MTFSKKTHVADAAPAAPLFREAGFAFEGGTTAAVEFWTRLSHEMVHFAADRMCETVKTQQQMMHCHNLSELAALRAHWWQRTVDQYAEEAGRLTGIWQDAIDRAVQVKVH